MHILTLSFSLSTAPLEQDLTTMTVPSWHQQSAQEGSKTMNSKPTTGLGNFRRVLRENISLITLFLQSPPGFQIQSLLGPSVKVQPPSFSSATPRLGSGELFHFWGPQMNSTILCWIVSCSNISWSILSPATCTSKHRNEYVPVKYIWQGFTAHCLVAGHTLYTGKHSSCFPMALLQAQMQQGWCQGSAGLGLLCNSSISLSSRRGEQTPTQAKLDNSSPRFHFKAQATRAGYFYWCYQSISKTADSREKCKQDFKLATLSKLTLPPPSCTLNKYTIKH